MQLLPAFKVQAGHGLYVRSCLRLELSDILIFITMCIPQGVDPNTKALGLTTTANQDPCLSLIPLLGIDMW